MAPASYSKKHLKEAVQKIKSGELIQNRAGKLYNIPISTLSDHVNGRRKSYDRGPPTILTREQDEAFADKLKDLAEKGFKLSRQMVRQKCADFCRNENIQHPFGDGLAGNTWYNNFIRRHPQLSLHTKCKSKVSTNQGKRVDKSMIEDYFINSSEYISQVTPDGMWNLGKSCCDLQHLPTQDVAEQGFLIVERKPCPSKETVTVMACGNAAGRVLPPMFVVEGNTHKSLNAFKTDESPLGSLWTWQNKGCNADSLGVLWLKQVFLKRCGLQRPQVIFLNNRHCHEAFEMSELAKENNIHIISFPPRTCRWLQPLYQKCFPSLSSNLKSSITLVNKSTFSLLFAQAWEKSMTPSNITAGFHLTGLHPFNPDIVPKRAFLTADERELPPEGTFSVELVFEDCAPRNQNAQEQTVECQQLSKKENPTQDEQTPTPPPTTVTSTDCLIVKLE